jgi:hypothetical protein
MAAGAFDSDPIAGLEIGDTRDAMRDHNDTVTATPASSVGARQSTVNALPCRICIDAKEGCRIFSEV